MTTSSGTSDGPTPVGGLPDDQVIAPLTFEELAEPLRSALQSRVSRLGYLGAFFSVLGHQPEALGAFNSFTEELKAALPNNVTELVALAIASALGNDYERVQHVRLAGVQGRSDEWIEEASWGRTEMALSPAERSIRSLAVAMLDNGGRGTREKIAAVVAACGETQAVGILLLIGRYVAHGHISNALEFTGPEQVKFA